jgi:hypothetical protein
VAQREAIEGIGQEIANIDQEVVREVLETGLTYMRQHGWTKYMRKAESGKVCAMGAVEYGWLNHLGQVTWDFPNGEIGENYLRVVAAQNRLSRKVNDLSNHNYLSVARFNDAKETTQQDVENLFEKTIADL